MEINLPNIESRLKKNFLFLMIVKSLSAIALMILILLIGTIFINGLSYFSFSDFYKLSNTDSVLTSGFADVLFTNFIMILLSLFFALPFGLALGIVRLESYGNNFIYKISSNIKEALEAIPSLIIGIIIFLIFSSPNFRYKILVGALALVLLAIPRIADIALKSLRSVSNDTKYAVLSMGIGFKALYSKMIIPSSLMGLLAGIINLLAYLLGETAALIFTAYNYSHHGNRMLEDSNSLGLMIFNLIQSGDELLLKKAWAVSLSLLFIIMLLKLISKIIDTNWKMKF